MNFDELVRAFWERPIYQRLFLAFTVGLFLSCAARVADSQEPQRTIHWSPATVQASSHLP